MDWKSVHDKGHLGILQTRKMTARDLKRDETSRVQPMHLAGSLSLQQVLYPSGIWSLGFEKWQYGTRYMYAWCNMALVTTMGQVKVGRSPKGEQGWADESCAAKWSKAWHQGLETRYEWKYMRGFTWRQEVGTVSPGGSHYPIYLGLHQRAGYLHQSSACVHKWWVHCTKSLATLLCASRVCQKPICESPVFNICQY